MSTATLEKIKLPIASDTEKLEIKNVHTDIYLPLFITEFADEKHYTKFIKNVERVVRASLEYKMWLKFLRENLGMTKCVFTGETLEETDDIEIHHHPFTLYDICKIVVDTYLKQGKPFCTFTIAMEVIQLHFQLNVGFVPIAGTLHKKFHNGYLEIPREYIYGNPKYLIDNYYVTESLIEKYEKYMSVTLDADIYQKSWNLKDSEDGL